MMWNVIFHCKYEALVLMGITNDVHALVWPMYIICDVDKGVFFDVCGMLGVMCDDLFFERCHLCCA